MSTDDQLLLAKISGLVSRHCARHVIDHVDSAVAEQRELAGDRPDLLAEHAGVQLGLAEADIELLASRRRAQAQLCILAGADETLVPYWTAVGRERAEAARQIPYSGGR